MITLIVGRDRKGAIGKGNEIPWHAPEDLAFFQRETTGGALIMGRNTWDSLPFKPLKNRLNLVVSSRMEGEHVVPSLDAAIEAAHAAGSRRLYGIGGYQVYHGLLPKAHRLLITEVGLEVEAPDTFFPDFDPAEWRLIGKAVLRQAGPHCEMFEYLRRG